MGQGLEQAVTARLDQPELVLKTLGTYLLPGLTQGSKVFTFRHLLQPGSPQDLQTLAYLQSKKQIS